MEREYRKFTTEDDSQLSTKGDGSEPYAAFPDTMIKIAVIVPVHNGRIQLVECLGGIAHSSRYADQVIVVDDSSTDGSETVAREFGFECISLRDGPHGPARARNQGVTRAVDADVLVFVDSDVVIQERTLEQIERHFLQNPGIDALFGSYDQNPRARDVVSLYKNLEHHHVHQTSRREASTFWAGCGAVRRSVFQAAGKFDEAYKVHSIEDIELGSRMKKFGYQIELCPDLQVTHLKNWTLGELIHTDIFRRAIPWSRLLMKEGKLLNDLNLSTKRRFTALAAVALVMSVSLLWQTPGIAGVTTLIAAVVFVVLNADLLKLFRRQGGIRFSFVAGALHLLYYLYSIAAFTWVACERVVKTFWKIFPFRRKILRRV